MRNAVVAFVIAGAVCAVIAMSIFTPQQNRAALSYYNGEHQLGLAYNCGMVAENNRLLKLQELKTITEDARCAKYRKMWERISP